VYKALESVQVANDPVCATWLFRAHDDGQQDAFGQTQKSVDFGACGRESAPLQETVSLAYCSTISFILAAELIGVQSRII